ncbi:MAG: type II toxin-antitoxin system PemK/MazF family toxin [Patescibacteria group bacterium]|nr:type II toxin-antitoxin system PemK/MazF family toxin [Patescibacteria group bacterium]
MKKKFNRWNKLKKVIHDDGENHFYHEREIWWCSLVVNVGFEEDGKGSQFERPVLIIRGFSRRLCWIVPLSSSPKINPYYIPIGMVDGEIASALISHLRLIDNKRFINRVGYLDREVFQKTKQAIKALL